MKDTHIYPEDKKGFTKSKADSEQILDTNHCQTDQEKNK